MRSLVHKLKYSSNLVLAKFFANEIAASITFQKIPKIRSSIVIPVPIHNKRHKFRGYSQTHLIARALSAKLNIPYDYWSLTQIKITVPQTGLSKQDRKQNVKRAYRFDPNPAYCSQNIIIVDDVITTGSTINSIVESVSERYPSHKLIFCSITRTSNADSSAFIKR